MKGFILEVSVKSYNGDVLEDKPQLIKVIATFSLGDQFFEEPIDVNMSKDALIKTIREQNFPEILAYLKLLPGLPIEGYYYDFIVRWQ